MDYRKLLGKTEDLVLPYLGGPTLDAPGRRLRLAADLAPGWWRFRVQGRVATALGPAEPEAVERLPSVRGHYALQTLVQGGALAEALHLLRGEEPASLSPCRARRWVTGELLFEAVDFETEAEDAARRALEEGAPLAGIKGIGASLRAAYGVALLEARSRALGVPVSPREVEASLLDVAERGVAAADEILRRLDAERREWQRAEDERRRVAGERAVRETVARERVRRTEALRRSGRRAIDDAAGRAEEALVAAGARLASWRALDDGRLEVTFRFSGERFISVVDAATLQVVDSGICLSGADREITLESLPSVIREAIQTSRLVITRR